MQLSYRTFLIRFYYILYSLFELSTNRFFLSIVCDTVLWSHVNKLCVTMHKRKIASCESDTSYAVIETKDKNGSVFVQLIPTSWLRPIRPNSEIIARALANFYFPRRLPGQTIDQHLKLVKNAKFVCMAPQNDDKWELLNCRVLTINLGKHNFSFVLRLC